MPLITGIIADSAGAPANGLIEFAQMSRLDTGTELVTQTVATAQVVDGELRAVDGVQFSMPQNPTGTAVRVLERLGGRTFEWWTQIPATDVEYRSLVPVEPIGTPQYAPPPWLADVINARDDTIAASEDAANAATAAGVAKTAAESARDAAQAVGNTNDTIMASRASDPTSAFTTVMFSQYGAIMKAPAATGSDQTTALNSAIASAASFGIWLQLNGNHVIANQLLAVTGARIDGAGGTITQTGTLKTGIRLNSVSNVRIRNLRLLGKTSDYVNNSTVYGAVGIYVSGTSSDVLIEACNILGWAGAGVYLGGTCTDVKIRGCVLTGAGSTYVLNTTYNYSGGVVADPGITNVVIHDNDISGFAQGVVTGDNIVDWKVTRNTVHDIPGQHGFYLESMLGGVVQGNIIRNTGLTGMKIQIGTTTAIDTKNVIVADNSIRTVGAQGILLTNVAGGTPRIRETVVIGNSISGAAGGGIEINNCIGVHFGDNQIFSSRFGYRITSCSRITVDSGQVSGMDLSGISIISSQDVTVDSVRIRDVGAVLTASDQFGIRMDGTTLSDVWIRSVVITDANAKMSFGVYLVDVTNAGTISITDCDVSGATSYGWRMTSVAAVRRFQGNNFAGTTGAYLNPPSNFAQYADTTGATLAALETEVNKLKAVLRATGLIRV